MTFFDLQKYRRDEYEVRKLHDENVRLEQELKDRKWREQSAGYEREQEDYRARERLERERENARELRFNLYHEKKELQDELEDLKLRRKFGVEGGKD